MLKRPVPSSSRRIAGLLLSLVAVSFGGAMAWAAQPATPLSPAPTVPAVPPGKIGLAMEVKIDDGGPRTLTAVLDPGIPETFEFDAGDEHWRIDATIVTVADGSFDLTAKLVRDGELVEEPRLLFKGDAGAAVGIGEQRPDGSFDGIMIELRAKAGLPEVTSDAAAALMPPPYPPAALANGEGGTVMLALRVGVDGRVLEARYEAAGSTLGESSSLVQAARDAAMKWQLQPAMEDGRAIEGWVQVPVQFEPDGG